MEQAVLAKDVWDWTYISGWKNNKKMDVSTVEYLKKLYCDPSDNNFIRNDACTTCLQLFSSDLDEEFGESIYIAGVALTSSHYEQIFDIPKEELLPNVVIKINSDIIAYTDQIAMTFVMHRAVDFIFHAFSKETDSGLGFIQNEASHHIKKPLSQELRSALRIE